MDNLLFFFFLCRTVQYDGTALMNQKSSLGGGSIESDALEGVSRSFSIFFLRLGRTLEKNKKGKRKRAS